VAHRFSMISIVAVALLAAGCAEDVAYRTEAFDPSSPGATSWPETCAIKERKGPSLPVCSGKASIEHRGSRDDPAGTENGYVLGFVEYDDQGMPQDDRQEKDLIKILEWIRDVDRKKMIIVVYAHGWKHNAHHEDKDVDLFQRFLESVNKYERLRVESANGDPDVKQRKVVGIYIGWRGQSIDLPLLEQATFWTRKNTAERVGDSGQLQKLLEKIRRVKITSNGNGPEETPGGNNGTQLITIGHSFGGYLLQEALRPYIVAGGYKLDESLETADAVGYGDFILLINPAFEGTKYEAIQDMGFERQYTAGQRPVTMIVTARNDWATGWAFPIGRLYTIAQSAPHEGEREAVLNTVGHIERFRTHILRTRRDEAGNPLPGDTDQAPDSQDYAQSPQEIGQKSFDDRREEPDAGALSDLAHRIIAFGKIEMIPVTQEPPANYPYLVAYADSDIINGHNGIYNEDLHRFIIALIGEEVLTKQPTRELGEGGGMAKQP
jgi:hypothetical protein